MTTDNHQPYDSFTIRVKTFGPTCPRCGFMDFSRHGFYNSQGDRVCPKCGTKLTKPQERTGGTC